MAGQVRSGSSCGRSSLQNASWPPATCDAYTTKGLTRSTNGHDHKQQVQPPSLRTVHRIVT